MERLQADGPHKRPKAPRGMLDDLLLCHLLENVQGAGQETRNNWIGQDREGNAVRTILTVAYRATSMP